MNISITNECNHRCEYCFQKEWYLSGKDKPKQEMSVTDFELAIKFSGKEPVKLLGGEPLLHSQIDEILEILDKQEKQCTMISNICVKDIVPAIQHKCTGGWLINTDTPVAHLEMFEKNYRLLLEYNNSHPKEKKYICLSTTMLPDDVKIQKTADRLITLAKIASEYNEKIEIRVSTTSPNFCDSYHEYDYSASIRKFIEKIWAYMPIQIHFDCSINACELNKDLILWLYQFANMINFRIVPCNGERCPLDILVDGSVIFCSSANFLRLKSFKRIKNIRDAKYKMNKMWVEYWQNNKLQCDYKHCESLPHLCNGLCIAKNEAMKLINKGE